MKHKIKVVMLQPQHLYITVSQDVEPIKEGDWCFRIDTREVFKTRAVSQNIIGQADRGGVRKDLCRKIIATNDQLTVDKIATATYKAMFYKNTLPQIQQLFLKEYVANPDGEFEVEYKTVTHNKSVNGFAPMFTTNELKLNQDNTVNITAVKERGITITNVEEKLYSRKDMLDAYRQGANNTEADDQDKAEDNWIKENL
tara:strand:+ start:1571 stop:2167 length:597 start_codon:yes stop_codon:yes gene_type:complete